jgi:ABC-type glycerol-3-phosphate transport system substrate-binding protein
MPGIGRRKLLKLSGAGALAAKTGGIAAILASNRAPAYAQGATVHWLRWNDFVPTSDALLRNQIIPACAKDLGITLNIEMINGNDIQARTTAAIQSGTGLTATLCEGQCPSEGRRDQGRADARIDTTPRDSTDHVFLQEYFVS